MLFKRARITAANAGVVFQSPAQSGFVDNAGVTAIATDANLTLTTAQMAAGIITFTGFTAGRNVTTPTAAAILAEAPDMDIGDSFHIKVATLVAFAATWVAGAGVTLAGRATTPANATTDVFVTKTSATTVTWTVI